MIPNLPTDNLYKFIALSGVFLVCFSLYFIESRYSKLSERVYQETMTIAVLKVRVSTIIENGEDLLKVIKNQQADKQKFPKNRDKAAIIYSEEEIKSMRDKWSKSQFDLSVDNAKIFVANDYSRKLVSHLTFIWIICAVLGLVGIFMAHIGFTNWYYKVQRPVDKLNESDET